MKLYFMKQEALDILKDNLEIAYKFYLNDYSTNWLHELIGDDPFVEYKEIPDFELESLTSGLSMGEVDLNNCKIIYDNLKFLTESQACDERLWAGLCHTVFYQYLRKRFGYDTKSIDDVKTIISGIKSRFMFSGGIYRNSISKCWWVGKKTYDEMNINKYEKLDVIGSSDISTKISDIFYSNNFVSNKTVLNGIIKGLKYFRDEGIKLNSKEHIRKAMRYFNIVGGGIILDCLTEEEVSSIFIEYVESILQDDNQDVEITDLIEEYDVLDSIEENIGNELIEQSSYATLGDKVTVYCEKINIKKTYVIKNSSKTGKLPLVAEMILGKYIGDKVIIEDIEYIIDSIN